MSLPIGSRPDFATNDAETGERVADALNTLLSGIRVKWVDPPRVAIATAYFNPGGFNLLADELEQVGGARLLLGAEPTDITDGAKTRPLREKRRRRGPAPEVQRALEGHARSLADDRDLLGFTKEADQHARRLVKWLREHPDVEVRRYEQGFLHGKAFAVETDQTGVIAGSSNFTYAGLARNNELNLGHYQPATVQQVLDWFEKQWAASAPYDLAALYEARWAAHQPWDVFLRMLYENYGIDADDQPSGSRLGLTAFQTDGVWRAKRILQRRNGVLVADEVGLGKTFIGGELIHEATYERRQKVLIVCPATLRDSTWNPFLRAFDLRADVVSFEELVASIDSAGERMSALQAIDDYAMVIVDEAHAMRNDKTQRAHALHRLLQGPVPKQLVLMTATPVNNSLEDLFVLIMYFARSDAAFSDIGIPSLRRYFNAAIAMNPDDLSPEHLFDVLDSIAVRRTRRFVKNHYVGDKIIINGVEKEISFPTSRVRRVDYDLTAVLPDVFDDLATALGADVDDHDATGAGVILVDPGSVLTMARYVPSQFRLDGDTEQYESQNAGLLRSGLLKRFESSSYAFCKTVEKMIDSHNKFLHALANGLVLTGATLRAFVASDNDDVDEFMDELDDAADVGDAAEYNVAELTAAVTADRDLLIKFRDRVGVVDHTNDPKIKTLIGELVQIAADAEAEGIGDDGDHGKRNKQKALIFTYFADTADYIKTALDDALLSDSRLECYRDRFEIVSGPNKANRSDIITGFAPTTAGTGVEEDKYDLLVSTDVLAEGVNLQQARHIINYDLPWNPMRLVQRHGRIDRIGSPHLEVFMRCFFPTADLDRLLGLEERLQRKIKQAAASIGVGEVLPGVNPVDRSITETRDMIEAIRREENRLFEEGTNAALSGEEFRRRLSDAFKTDATKNRVLDLPWGAGSGFTRASADHAFVFCARVGDHEKPLYRYVPLNAADLSPQSVPSDDGDVPVVVRETLSCLAHADPGPETTPPVLSEEMYAAAFDAWSVARDDIYEHWTLMTDAAALRPQLPKAMREAVTYVEAHGGFLGEKQDALVERLRSPYTTREERALRTALGSEGTPQERVAAIEAVAEEFGMVKPEVPEPLPPITPDDIHLVCWTAISPAEPEQPVGVAGALPPSGDELV